MQGAYTPNIHIHTRECWKNPINDSCYIFYIEVLQSELMIIQQTLKPIKAKIDRIHTDIQHLKLEDDTHARETEKKTATA